MIIIGRLLPRSKPGAEEWAATRKFSRRRTRFNGGTGIK